MTRAFFLHLATAVAIAFSTCLPTQARTATRYVSATQLFIINKGFDNAPDPYSRLNASMRDSVRPNLWQLSLCSAGLAVRFATNSTAISCRYNFKLNCHMNHMADTGIKGADLYRLGDDGHWAFVNTCRPSSTDSIQQATIVENMDGLMHEYTLYLPLYDGVNWLEIGVDSTAVLQKPTCPVPASDRKLVFYGTSIMQGGCATRPGMCATNILQRRLGLQCVNLGFSGEGKLDLCLARAMASIPEAAAYIVDPVPNCTEQMCDSLAIAFVGILRTLRPEVPVIMVESPVFPFSRFDASFGDLIARKNAALRRSYEKLAAQNPKGLYYVDSHHLYGDSDEWSVDGIHATDLGFTGYANTLAPVITKALNEANVL